MFETIQAAALAVTQAPDLFFSKIKLKEKYPALKTQKRKPDTWWNSLGKDRRFEVGSAALHFHLITPNYCWNMNSGWSDLYPKQKRAIKFVFNHRHDNWSMFDLVGMLGIR